MTIIPQNNKDSKMNSPEGEITKNNDSNILNSSLSISEAVENPTDIGITVPSIEVLKVIDESENDSIITDSDFDEKGNPIFPHELLLKLDEMVNKTKWIIPVLPKAELEVLMNAAIKLSRKGLDTKSEACQRFFSEGMTISFTKVLMDDAVSTWKFEIHKCILKNTEKLIELCVVKLEQDWFPLLDLLAIALNPNSKFHLFNTARNSEFTPSQGPFARCNDCRQPKGWLVDLVNQFGDLGGFHKLKHRLCEMGSLNVQVVCALIKPFGQCVEVLTEQTVEQFLIPVVKSVKSFLDSITDEVLKKESKNESKNEAISVTIKSMKLIVARLPGQEELCKQLEELRLLMILRLLQVSPFNGKMNALNEINRVISSVSYYSHHRHNSYEEDEYLTNDMVAKWLQENNVLVIVLKDNLHQPQYVEKLEKIIRFTIKAKTLTVKDLDTIWMAQLGKHEAIVKNVHDLLAKLAWDFSAEQLDHLFSRFQAGWNSANKKQQEKLLELIRRLAEDDKEGVIAHKVLNLLWQLAHSDDLPTDIMDQALNAHIKILDYSCSQTQDRDSLKIHWIDLCVEELKGGSWVIPALKQIRAICELFYESGNQVSSHHVLYRNNVVENIQNKHAIVSLVAENLTKYMGRIRNLYQTDATINPEELFPDRRYAHVRQIQERLDFLRFILNDGKMWLCQPQAEQIWICLAINSVFPVDQDICFKWFSTIMGDDPDLDPDITRLFFENNVLKTDPAMLNEHGLKCFERFFKFVNIKEGYLQKKRNGTFVLENTQLIGYDYLWKVITQASVGIATQAIEVLREIYSNLGSQLKSKQNEIHTMFIKTCSDRIHPCEEIMCNTDFNTPEGKANILKEAHKVTACLRALKVYVEESDKNYTIERSIPAHERSARGKQICLYIRFPQQNRQVEDFEVWSHSNESIASLRRRIYVRLKNAVQAIKLDICYNNEVLNPADDRKLISDLAIKDRGVFAIKFGSTTNSVPSSPDSSSDSSPPPTPQLGDGPNVEAEHLLPAVILSRTKFVQMLFTLGDLSMKFHLEELQDIVLSLLKICSSDVETINNIKTICHNSGLKGMSSVTLEKLFSTLTPIQALYNLEVIYALLLPAMEPLENYPNIFQHNIILAGGVDCILNMFTNKNFLHGANTIIQRMVYSVLLKISKLFLTTICFAHITVVAEALNKDSGKDIAISSTQHNYAIVLQQASQHIPNTYHDYVLRSISIKLGQALSGKATKYMPDIYFVKIVQKICWAAAAGDVSLHQMDFNNIHSLFEKHEEVTKCASFEDSNLAKEAFEVMTIALTLCPMILETLIRDNSWHLFIVDTLLLCKSSTIRSTAAEQCFLIATKCCNLEKPLKFFIQLLFTVRDTKATEHSMQSQEYFSLFCRLLNYGRSINFQLPNATKFMEQELKWLRQVQNAYLNGEPSRESTDDVLLEGHLGLIKELLQYHSIQKRYHIGCEEGGEKLIERLLNDFVFSSSRSLLAARKGVFLDQIHPMCKTQQTIKAALELLISLASNCVPNLRLIADYLTQLYYTGYDGAITEWEYQPPIGPRPDNGFVGLKNAGATCYMNSVLQQLFMIPEIASGVLSVDVGYEEEDENHYEKKILNIDNDLSSTTIENKELVEKNKQKERQQYNTKVLCQVQAIFGHLYGSKLQYYVPNGFWQVFRLWGEPVNLREQHDAYEFFNTLVDNIDEALKALSHSTICSNILGGSFADQKICKQCPHRYSRETPFTAINVDVRNHHNLIDSLEQYVKGDLLEGANAYFCERCDKKVDTVKRLCIRKLPKVLAIQLKRFDYDWERDCAVKFNDYFEFPREFDLEPFTVEGLAKIEGEIIEEDIIEQSAKTQLIDDDKEKSTIYKLVGVTVHSGQASGGHYYSYITNRSRTSGKQSWYKFDDGDVSDCNMDDDEELKNQCFGGEYMGEVFDHMLKRRQKRWWNAYLLFYERLDIASKVNRQNSSPSGKLVMPSAIEKSVCKENIQFLHTKMQFSPEYFNFMHKLVLSSLTPQAQSSPHKPIDPVRDDLHFICLQLLSKFLFTVCFHTKKSIRGSANDWYEAIANLVRLNAFLRRWFVIEVLLSRPDRIVEYLLECPVAEVRSAFGRIIILLAHLTRNDGCFSVELLSSPLEPWQVAGLDPTKVTLSDYLMRTVIEVLHRESSENNPRHLLQYFQLFVMYAGIGPAERKQLLDLGVLLTFIRLAIEEEFNNSVKYQYAESAKLYSLVSVLIRSCDVTKYMNSAIKGEPCKPNPYLDSMASTPIMEIPSDVEGLIYTSNCIKKFLEESNNSEDTVQLIKFLSWECLSFSLIALSEVLYLISYAYTYELRPFLDILLHLLLMNDSWQEHRLKSAFNGVSDDREGLFDTIQRSKSHSHKRGYQCIKAIVQLIQNCELAHQLLMKSEVLKEKWKSAIIWLGEELERRAPSAYNYNNWSPPTASNETSNGYFLERSQSARFTYAKARELFDESEEEEPEDEIVEHLSKQFNDGFSDNLRSMRYCGSESEAIQVPKLSTDSVVHLDISNDASLNDDESDS